MAIKFIAPESEKIMNCDILTDGGIDYNRGLSRFLGDAVLYERVLEAFAEDDVALRARAAYDRNDMAGLLSAVHEAKGTSGNMVLEEAYRLACRLVTLLRGENYTDEEISSAFLEFEKEYLSAQVCILRALEE